MSCALLSTPSKISSSSPSSRTTRKRCLRRIASAREWRSNRPGKLLNFTARDKKISIGQSTLESHSSERRITTGFMSLAPYGHPRSSLATQRLWSHRKASRRSRAADMTKFARLAINKEVPAYPATNVAYLVSSKRWSEWHEWMMKLTWITDHVECARQQGHLLAFDISPVKSSRRDQFNIVTVNGESGTMSAVLWCRDHIPTKTIAHKMYDVVPESGLTTMQLYAQNYKQADLALTGTVRKANLMMTAAKMSGLPLVPAARRTSTTTAPTTASTTAVATPNGASNHSRNGGESTEAATNARQPGEKVCITCGIDVTPRWWPIDNTQERQLTNGHHGTIGFEAQKFVEQRKFQCHKCKKNPKTPKTFAPHPSPPPPVAEPPRQHLSGPHGQTAAPPSMRSPPRAPAADYRAAPLRPEIHSLLHHPASHAPPPPGPPASHGPPPMGGPPPHSQAHSLGPRPAPVSHDYPQVPPPRPTYSDWGSQHGSPPRHINGGPPPPLHSTAPPPAPGLTALRPPSMSGPPAVAPISVPHHHAHGSPIYGSALPPSPRRLNGTAAPLAYVPPYGSAAAPAHASAPRHSASPGLSNGVLPPRSEAFSHGLHPQRPSYASGSHGSPPLARSGLPPPGGPAPPPAHEPTHSAGGLGHRPPDNRPASGASASPSLRNLLS